MYDQCIEVARNTSSIQYPLVQNVSPHVAGQHNMDIGDLNILLAGSPPDESLGGSLDHTGQEAAVGGAFCVQRNA
jgi:hypothetical protein